MEAVATANKEDRAAMDSREAVMVDHQAATVVDSTKEEVMVGSTEVRHQDRVVMVDTRAVIKVHQVAIHHKEETKVDIQDTRVATLDTRACLRPKKWWRRMNGGDEFGIDIRKRICGTLVQKWKWEVFWVCSLHTPNRL